jgi:hypothetical protein
VVLKGSTGPKDNVDSMVDTTLERFREKLVTTGILRVDGSKVILEKDYLFNSPSYAAIALIGRNANGWNIWKSKNGETLDELKRQNV